MSNCQIAGKATGVYDAEDAIVSLLEPLFPDGHVFSQYDITKISSEFFRTVENVDDRIAALVVNAGFSVPEVIGNRKANVIKPLWRIIVVAPSELYKSHAGVKLMEVIKVLTGETIYSDTGKPLTLSTDVREFNEPDFVSDVVSIPCVFTYDLII